jgi:regulator of RNase E activity RraA
MNVTIKMDGVLVRPGYILVSDGTKIVSVPMEVAEEVLKRAITFNQQDKIAIEEIRRGMTFTEALKKHSKI